MRSLSVRPFYTSLRGGLHSPLVRSPTSWSTLGYNLYPREAHGAFRTPSNNTIVCPSSGHLRCKVAVTVFVLVNPKSSEATLPPTLHPAVSFYHRSCRRSTWCMACSDSENSQYPLVCRSAFTPIIGLTSGQITIFPLCIKGTRPSF